MDNSFSIRLAPPPTHLAWNRDGTTLAVASRDRIALFDAACDSQRYRPLHELLHPGGGLVVAFDPSGEILYSGSTSVRTLRFWHARTGKLLLSDAFFLLPDCFQRSGHLISCYGGILWEVATGKECRTLASTDENGSLWVPTIGGGGRLLAVGQSLGVSFWDLEHGTEVGFLTVGNCRRPVFEAAGALLTKSDAGLRRWLVRLGADAISVGPCTDLGFPSSSGELWADSSRDGSVVAQADYNGVLLLHPGQPLLALGPLRDCRSVAVSPDGRWVAGVSHSTYEAVIWDAPTGTRVKVLPDTGRDYPCFSPDGRWLAFCGRLWTVGSWEKGAWIGAHGVAFAPLGSWEKAAWIGAHGVAFAPRGDVLASHTEGAFRLIETRMGRELARLEDPILPPASHVTFSPDGTRLVTTNFESNTIHIWDLRLIRRQLSEMGMDWDQQAFPEPESAEGSSANPPLFACSWIRVRNLPGLHKVRPPPSSPPMACNRSSTFAPSRSPAALVPRHFFFRGCVRSAPPGSSHCGMVAGHVLTSVTVNQSFDPVSGLEQLRGARCYGESIRPKIDPALPTIGGGLEICSLASCLF